MIDPSVVVALLLGADVSGVGRCSADVSALR